MSQTSLLSPPVRIAIDAMGGDYGIPVTVDGAAQALPHLLQKHEGVSFLFFGDGAAIEERLSALPDLKKHVKIIHTDNVVSSSEKPSAAIRSGKESSMALSIKSVKQGDADCVVSGGNTGALMAFAQLILRPQPVVKRPAIGTLLPSVATPTLMLDLGANVSSDGESLVQHAVLGAVYAKCVMKIEKPQIGILNIGSEASKGHEDVQDAARILSQAEHFPGSYYGFVEGDDIGKGTVDVIVTDGFTGNVALKTAEGIGSMSQYFLKEAFMSSFWAKIGGLLCMNAMKRLKKRLDPRDYNGGLFLGLQGICIKSHGGTDAYGFSRAVEVSAQMIRNDYLKKVTEEIEQLVKTAENLEEQKVEAV